MAINFDALNKFLPMAQAAATENQVPLPLFLGLLAQESNFNPNAVSGAGAQGMPQFMPGTAKQFGINPFDPAQALPASAKFLRQNYDRFGSWDQALAAQNSDR
jgi:soluble lytic murein transglycosylase-like protein